MNIEELFIKYPRTLHLPNSLSVQNDDKIISDLSRLIGMECVFLEKLDGENTNMYKNGIHARSRTFSYHESRTWILKKHAEMCHDIPEGWRICAENMFALHSIAYKDLESYLYIFSIWNEMNEALSWDDTEFWADLFGFPTVKVLYRGEFSLKKVEEIVSKLDTSKQEGIVVRPAASFKFDDFSKVVAKWVRNNHVQTNKHWSKQKVVPNKLRS